MFRTQGLVGDAGLLVSFLLYMQVHYLSEHFPVPASFRILGVEIGKEIQDVKHGSGVMEPNVTVGIVDNDPLALHALRESFIRQEAPVHVLWTSATAQEALQYCRDPMRRPRLLLTDIEMPDMDGYQLCREIQDHEWSIEVIGISAFPSDQQGAQDADLIVMPKESTVRDLVQLAGLLMGERQLLGWAPALPFNHPLSDCELEALRHYAEGDTTSATAHAMHVSESTLKTFVKRAYDKLNVHGRTEAIVLCVRNGWI